MDAIGYIADVPIGSQKRSKRATKEALDQAFNHIIKQTNLIRLSTAVWRGKRSMWRLGWRGRHVITALVRWPDRRVNRKPHRLSIHALRTYSNCFSYVEALIRNPHIYRSSHTTTISLTERERRINQKEISSRCLPICLWRSSKSPSLSVSSGGKYCRDGHGQSKYQPIEFQQQQQNYTVFFLIQRNGE